MFPPVLGESIIGRAAENGILEIRLTDIREYSQDKHKKADDYPFGGGAGMIMLPDPAFRALNAIGAEGKRIIYMSPRGRVLNQKIISELSREEELVILCGHYEGVDQRSSITGTWKKFQCGDYILTGGELPAMILIDAVARMLPEVLGSSDAHKEESIYSGSGIPPIYKTETVRGDGRPGGADLRKPQAHSSLAV
jgi:tRNA (guanine37-N1)-methyltransferase